jgi:SAM-dependent methyltransferase
MGFIGGELGYRMLMRIAPGGNSRLMDGSAYYGKSKLAVLLGEDIWSHIHGKVVIDFGCGHGHEAIEMAKSEVLKVIGLDIQEELLAAGRERAQREGLAHKCLFVTKVAERADIIVTLDSFEHFDDPGLVLETMRHLLKPNGCVMASFGPTWLHPLGGHLFSVFPWAHLIFTERALIRWRSDFKKDGARRFREVAGGLNQMTISRFERIVEGSAFQFSEFDAVPIRNLARFSNRVTREFLTAIVRCKLVLRESALEQDGSSQ